MLGRTIARAFSVVLAVVAAWEFWYFTVFTLATSDTAWLIRTGCNILANHTVPSHDIFSWTMSQQQCLCYQWLFEVLLALVYRFGNLWAVGYLSALMTALLLFYFLPRIWLKQGVSANCTLFFVCLAMAPTLFYTRPQLVSYPLTLVFIYILERWRLAKARPSELFLLVPLSIIWANLHSFFVVGMFLLLLYTIDAGFESWQFKNNKVKLAILPVLLSICAVAVNPYGTRLLPYICSFAGKDSYNNVGELAPFWWIHENHYLPVAIYLIAFWMILLCRKKYVPRVGLAVAAMATVTALNLSRFCSLSIILTWTYLGIALAGNSKPDHGLFAKRELDLNKRTMSMLPSISALIVVICTASLLYFKRVENQEHAMFLFTGDNPVFYQFMLTCRERLLPASERQFNDESTGAYMGFFSLAPVFIDSRFDFYGKDFSEKWCACISAEEDWKKYLKSYKIDRIVIKNNWPLYRELMSSEDWLIAYDDGKQSVWLSNNEQHKKLIHELLWERMSPQLRALSLASMRSKAISTGRMLLAKGRIRQSVSIFKEALSQFQNDPVLVVQLIHVLSVAGLEAELSDELFIDRDLFKNKNATVSPKQWAVGLSKVLVSQYDNCPFRRRFVGR